MQEDKCQHIYDVGNKITFAVVFIGCWVFCIATGGFLLGVGLGWIPALICATLASTLLLPVIIFALGGVVLLAVGLGIFSLNVSTELSFAILLVALGAPVIIFNEYKDRKQALSRSPIQTTQTTYWPQATSENLLVCSDCNFTITEKEFDEDALFCPMCKGVLSIE